MTQQPPPQELSIPDALARAQAHWNAGQADQAEMFCQRILAVWPGHTDALHLMGLMAHAYGNLDLAIQHLRQACMAPRAPGIYFSNLAEMCRQKGLLTEGERAARNAVALAPNLVGAWNNLGIILQEMGQLEESLACLERVVSLEPQNAQARNNLGNTCKRLGRLDVAEAQYMQALAIDPDYAEAHSNLAVLLRDRGDLDRAAAEARRAIEINPQFADAYVNLAGIAAARHQHGECLRWADALLSFAPTHTGGLSARALALKQLDRLPEALDAAKRAVAAAPEHAEAYNALGQILQALDRPEEALAIYDKAAALPSAVTEDARISRAVLLMETGRKDEAREAFASLRQAYPNSASARLSSADLITFKPDDPEIAHMEMLLRENRVQSHGDRMALHFALGKAYMDAGDSDRAFQHLDAGNRMKRATFAYDGASTTRWLQSVAETFTPTLFKTFAGAGDPSALPVFVVGVPRSGTTLVEQVLASHPQVHGAGELRFLQRLVDSAGEFPAFMSRIAAGDLAKLGRGYLAQVEPMAQGKRHVIDKMPANFIYAGLIHLILPHARIVHCRRDPVDTCLSCYTKLFSAEQNFTYDLGELGRFHRDYQALMAHWRAVLPADRFIEVDYEAVVDDLEGQARRLIDFLGLPWDDACLNFHENRRAVRTASVNQVRQPIYKTSKQRWKAHAQNLGPLLDALGLSS